LRARKPHLFRRKTECACGQDKVLERRAESEMHFAAERIECSQIASAVGKERYRAFGKTSTRLRSVRQAVT
jgi:hypothetical protein